MAARYNIDGAAANGFGRRSLHEWEARLLHEAGYMALPDMRCPSGEWRLSAGGIPIPPVPRGVDGRAAICRFWNLLSAGAASGPQVASQ